MTIRLVRQPDEFAGASIHIPTDLAWKHFQELIQRGANLWPDAPPEIKEFADLVTNGKVMQDYYRQAATPATSLPAGHWRCACGMILKGGTTHMNCPNVQTNQEQTK